MWLLYALAHAAAPFEPPAGLRPEDTASALTACLTAIPGLFGDLKPRTIDVDHVGRLRAYAAAAPGASLPSVADAAIATCTALAAIPLVPDGALRCIALPKGGFSCKPIPGPVASVARANAALDELGPALDACVRAPAVWTVRAHIGADGALRDLDLNVRGSSDMGPANCLTDALMAVRTGPLVIEAPVERTVTGR
jgi:hypothetical protein